jgi:hypothetical protein
MKVEIRFVRTNTGRFVPANSGLYEMRVRNLKPGDYHVQIVPWEETRRIRANNLYWKWVEIIAEELGYDKLSLHEALKEKFLGMDEYVTLDGEVRTKPKESKTLSVKKFNEYMNNVHVFASQELGIVLPSPELKD